METGDAALDQVTLGAVCMHCTHNVKSNLNKYVEFIDEAAARGVRFLVFPEMSLPGYKWRLNEQGSVERSEQFRYFRSVAEPVPGPLTRNLQTYAARYGMLIQAGMAESAMDGNIVYNSAVLVGPEGVVGVFRKVHNPFEWPIFASGDSLTVVPTPLGKIGMFICYDLCFPEVVRAFALQGALLVSMSTAWGMEGEDPQTDPWARVYDILARSNALMNQVWMVSANQVKRPPKDGARTYYGHSMIISPSGEVLSDTGYDEGIAVATVNLREGIERARTLDVFGNNLLADRRPELYGILADKTIYYQSEVAVGANGQHPLGKRPSGLERRTKRPSSVAGGEE
jgi:predicted amidohydrolase